MVPIIVFCRPYEAAVGLESVADHGVNEEVVVLDASLSHGLAELFVDLLEDLAEPAVVTLEDGALGAKVEWPDFPL